MNMRRFEDAGVVITGGASGIGYATAERMLGEGGRVVLWDVDRTKLEKARSSLGERAQVTPLDITDPDQVAQAASEAEAMLGRITGLVCCAGVAGQNALVVDYAVAEWKRIFDVNVNGLFYCNQAVAARMMPHGYGRIVNVASIAGKEGNPTASAYSASKAAVLGFTKSLGKELAKAGITVNAITTATVDTPMLAQVSDAHLAYMRSKIPMERFGTTEEMASIICWLASPECSFTTGAVFDVSGGRATY